MDKKKILLIISVVVVLVGVGIFVYLRQKGKTPVSIPTSPSRESILPTAKITISGVSVSNFKSAPVEKNDQGDILFARNSEYDLVYLEKFNEFIITINSSPFETARKDAEKNFLARLGISEADACKLKVSMGTPFSVNPNEAGKVYKLSFCE